MQCKVCNEYKKNINTYKAHTSNSVNEIKALNREYFSLYKNYGIKLTSYAVYDKYDHLCRLDNGLIEKGISLYFSGYIKRIDDEDPSIINGLPVHEVGPIKEWWIYGFDGGEKSIIGLTTEHAKYYLMEPAPEYVPFFTHVQQKSKLSKRVIEFLLDYGLQNPTFEDLIQHIKNFQEFNEVEELLLHEAEFLCNQVLSYDEETFDEEIPMISFSCMQSLINRAGVTLNKSAATKSYYKDINANKKEIISITTTDLVKTIFENFFPDQLGNEVGKNKHSLEINRCDMPKNSEKHCNNERNEDDINDQSELAAKLTKHTECSKQILHSVKWLRENHMEYNNNQTYSSAYVGNFMVERGDTVMLSSEEPNEPPRIARVSYMYDLPLEGAMFHAHFFCRGTDTILGETANPRELFIVDDCCDYPLGCILRKANVEFKQATENWNHSHDLDTNTPSQENTFFFTKVYDYEFSRFKDYTEDPNVPCMSCKWQADIKRYETPTYKDNRIYWRNEEYRVGTGVFLEPGRSKDSSDSAVENIEIKRTTLYPELYRKKYDNIKGSNVCTPEPFTVGLIEDIKNSKTGFKIKVRMFYRPEDTRGIHFLAYSKDINYVYWTNHVIWTTLKYIGGKCYLAYQTDPKIAEKWTQKGLFRFYYSKAYNQKTHRIFEVPIEGQITDSSFAKCEGESTTIKNYEEAPQWEKLDKQPLRCMDIYAGCGGLSEGLHQAGAAKILWAIEKDAAPAKAFQLNNPDCTVYTEDCNKILENLLNGKGKEIGLPGKGDVELLVGGPPCQGFSGMNRFNVGRYSTFKNSQITTFLGYCDYYRPKYFIFENVRNFVSFKKNLILKLTLKCLLAMGYQIVFGILQAGNFGIPQTRRRFILMGASPGHTLPNFPEPLHVFSKSGTFLSVVVDGLRYDTGSNWTASLPYRTICVRDAIADLPDVENGAVDNEIPYNNEPTSHFQKYARKKNKTGRVTDHICKEMSPIVEARISHVPTYPGADWRDLPNIVVQLRNGSQTNILKYSYRTKKQEKTDPPKGVCRCSTGAKCNPIEKQCNTLIPWCLAHTADRHNNWTAVYGRLEWDGFFGTTVTNPEPMGTQGRVLHPEQNRVVSVRECARSQGFQDDFQFYGSILDKHRQIGNAVPPPVALALGREIVKALMKN